MPPQLEPPLRVVKEARKEQLAQDYGGCLVLDRALPLIPRLGYCQIRLRGVL